MKHKRKFITLGEHLQNVIDTQKTEEVKSITKYNTKYKIVYKRRAWTERHKENQKRARNKYNKKNIRQKGFAGKMFGNIYYYTEISCNTKTDTVSIFYNIKTM